MTTLDYEQQYEMDIRTAETVARSHVVDDNELVAFVSRHAAGSFTEGGATYYPGSAGLPELYIRSQQALKFAEVFSSLHENTAGWIYHHEQTDLAASSPFELYGEAALRSPCARDAGAMRLAPGDGVCVDLSGFRDQPSLLRVLSLLCDQGVLLLLTPLALPKWDQNGAVADWLRQEHFYVKVLECNQVFRRGTRDELGIW